MKAVFLFCLVLGALCSFALCDSNLRLIEFNETTRVWMTEEQVQAGLEECIATKTSRTFMDITDNQNLSANAVGANPPVPVAPTHQVEVDALLPKLSQEELRANIASFTSYSTRYYTSTQSVQAAEWLASKYREYSSHRSDVTVKTFKHSWAQPSVIARIEGSGDNSDEIVILGGHIDSISSSSAAPGADDDASGSISVLEVFRVLAQSDFKPSRSIEFHGYAAEEVGLKGSQAIAQSYQSAKVVVAGMMQLDMVGYFKAGTKPVVSMTSDYTSSALNAFVKLLVTDYATIPPSSAACGYGCSDHASWYKAGYLACHPFESSMSNTSPNIHTPSDTLSRIDLDHAMEFVRVGLSFAVELGLTE